MFVMVISDVMIRPHRSRQHKRNLVLPNGVARPIFYSRFWSRISKALKSEGRFIEMGRLLGVSDIKFDVIRPLERQKILFDCRSFLDFWSSNCRWHNDL